MTDRQVVKREQTNFSFGVRGTCWLRQAPVGAACGQIRLFKWNKLNLTFFPLGIWKHYD